MSGFVKTARPELAGTYIDFVTTQPAATPPAPGHVVALFFLHTWGPSKTVTPLNSFADFLALFGGDPTNPSPGYIACKEAFTGSGAPGEGGAGQVLAYRAGGSALAKATRVLQNTAVATAITLSGKYPGTTGNGLRVTVQDHAADSSMDELLILDSNGNVLETYVYADTDIVALAAAINLTSAWVTAVEAATGTKLTYVASVALTGGADGSTLVSQDYVDALTALEVQRFGVLAFANLTDSSIQASVFAWAQGQNAGRRRFFTVFGGATDESITTAITRSAALNDPNVVNVGVGHVVDENILDSSGNPVALSTAQLAPRIAGVLASRGERMSLTFTKLVGIDLTAGASAADIVKAYDNGVVVLSRASDPAATVRIEKGLTTWTTTTDATRPKGVFSNPKFVATMQGVQNDLQVWADDELVGSSTVDDETRHAGLAKLNTLLRQRQELGSIQPGWSTYIDPDPPPSDDDQFVAFVIAARFGRSVEQVYFSAQMG